MAIRLRVVDGEMVALCAARTVVQEGDLYLDDGHHYALTCKFAQEWGKWNDDHHDELVESQDDAGQVALLEEWWVRHSSVL